MTQTPDKPKQYVAPMLSCQRAEYRAIRYLAALAAADASRAWVLMYVSPVRRSLLG